MTTPSLIVLYVDDPQASAGFYRAVLGCEPVESSPTFVMFRPENGAGVGLWARASVEPAPQGGPGASEITCRVPSRDEVEALHRTLASRGTAVAQPPVQLDFGYGFVALDPDGHRLRVFFPAPE